MKLIEKDAVLAIIEKRKQRIYPKRTDYTDGQKSELVNLSLEINALEAKKVDLAKTMKEEIDDVYFDLNGVAVKGATQYLVVDDIKEIAKHFFELGLRASNPLTWEDIKEICIQSVLVEIDLGGKISDERHYSEVLKRFKEQKGEEV